MNILSSNTSMRFNNDLFLSESQEKIFIKNNDFFVNSFFEDKYCKVENYNIQDHFSNFDFIKKSFVYIITETVAEYPYPYFSEKTWKAILFKMPFLIVGSKHSLKKLREFGFRTFSDFWNEDYDNFDLAADRIDAVVRILRQLSELSIQELDNLNREIVPIVEYNQNHIKQFYFQQINKFEKDLEYYDN